MMVKAKAWVTFSTSVEAVPFEHREVQLLVQRIHLALRPLDHLFCCTPFLLHNQKTIKVVSTSNQRPATSNQQ